MIICVECLQRKRSGKLSRLAVPLWWGRCEECLQEAKVFSITNGECRFPDHLGAVRLG